MKALLLLKHNIDALLKARGETRRDLAQHTLHTLDKRADSWISHIFGPKGFHTREISLKHLDRIADFFGLTTYQLFTPGISPLTERRVHTDRRTGRDRRVRARAAGAPPVLRASDLELTPADVADVLWWKSLPKGVRAQLRKTEGATRNPRSNGDPSRAAVEPDRASDAEASAPTPAAPLRRK